MVRRIHHINFIVRDLEAAISSYEQILGMAVTSRDRLDERGVAVARFRLADTWLILVEPVRPGTAPARHLESHGEGFFLMSLEVDSLAEEKERLGTQMYSGTERSGLDDWRVIDMKTDKTFGAQLQIMMTGATTGVAAGALNESLTGAPKKPGV
jgi:methylmalonyl-CoA/ethylmalonyl-CoA epimerase